MLRTQFFQLHLFLVYEETYFMCHSAHMEIKGEHVGISLFYHVGPHNQTRLSDLKETHSFLIVVSLCCKKIFI